MDAAGETMQVIGIIKTDGVGSRTVACSTSV